MSDLQIVLIILGFFIIAGVVVYNWLQERKLRENISEDFIVPQKDVLVEEFYIDTDALVEKEFAGDAHKSELIKRLNEATDNEEIASPPPSNADKAEHPHDAAAEEEGTEDEATVKETTNKDLPLQSDTSVAVEHNPPRTEIAQEFIVEKNILPAEFEPLVTSSLPDDVHSQIDLTAFLYATKSINGQAFNQMMQTMLKEINVFVMLHGLDDKNVWQHINNETHENTSYKQIACSLQLADRRGPVPKPVLNKFQFAVETIGLEFNAHVEWQGKGDPSQRAVDLDKFCMDVDQ